MNNLRPVVNQRLYFASLHLGWLQEQLGQQQVARGILEQSLGESIVLHLMMAYRSYLRELAQAYQLTGADPVSAREFAQLLQREGAASAECNELLALEQRDSWLSELLLQFQSLGTDTPPEKPQQPSGAIPIREVAGNALSLQSLETLHHELRTLIEQQRSCLEEW